MPDLDGPLGTQRWREAFDKSIRNQARIARLGHLRSVSPGPPRFIPGNQAFYLQDGQLQLLWMLAAIERAQTRVDLEMYIIEPDETGRKLRDALVDAARRGVVVRLIYDSVGCNAAGAEFFEPMKEAGAFVVEFNPLAPWRLRMGRLGFTQRWEPNRRDHRKLLVCDAPECWARHPYAPGEEPAPHEICVDEKRTVIAITGGRNIGDVYMGLPLGAGQWRDCGVVMFGPVGMELGKLFDAMWFHADTEDAPHPELQSGAVGDQWIMPIGSQPGFFNLLQWALSRLARSVREELRISCAYFVPSARWRRALRYVARRTGRVAVLVPHASDVPIVDAASRHLWGTLLIQGVAIYRYPSEVLHEKTFIYDGIVTVVGSSNLDPRSFRLNYELSVVVVGEEFAAPVVIRHQEDLEQSERYTLDAWRGRSRWQKVVDWFWALWRRQL